MSGSLATNDDVPPGTTYGNPTPRSSNPPGGVLTLNPDGTYTFISPNPGTYYYEVEVCAAGQTIGCPKTLLKIDVLPLDPSIKLPPVANHDVAYTPINTDVTLRTLLNDRAMQPGATLNVNVSLVAGFGPTNGTIFSISSTGDITFRPTNGFTGTDTYYYRVCDNQSPTPLCDTAAQTIYISTATPPNSTQASDDYNSTTAGVAISGDVKTNDYDPQSHPTTVTALDSTIAGKGRLVLSSTGSYTFTPAPGFYGPVFYPYTICDDRTPPACAMATLYILVKPFIPDPDVNITFVNVQINGSVATNDDVPPGTTYGTNPTPKSTNPSGGVLTLSANGTYTFTSPNPGTYYYEVEVCPAGVSSGCPKTLLKIDVLPLDPAVKSPPVANHDIAYTKINTPIILPTFNNDVAMEPGKILNPATLDTISGLGSRNGTV
ncbi:MAG: Ig-like domain-containing protein, partial [Bacteroidota bacterium]